MHPTTGAYPSALPVIQDNLQTSRRVDTASGESAGSHELTLAAVPVAESDAPPLLLSRSPGPATAQVPSPAQAAVGHFDTVFAALHRRRDPAGPTSAALQAYDKALGSGSDDAELVAAGNRVADAAAKLANSNGAPSRAELTLLERALGILQWGQCPDKDDQLAAIAARAEKLQVFFATGAMPETSSTLGRTVVRFKGVPVPANAVSGLECLKAELRFAQTGANPNDHRNFWTHHSSNTSHRGSFLIGLYSNEELKGIRASTQDGAGLSVKDREFFLKASGSPATLKLRSDWGVLHAKMAHSALHEAHSTALMAHLPQGGITGYDDRADMARLIADFTAGELPRS